MRRAHGKLLVCGLMVWSASCGRSFVAEQPATPAQVRCAEFSSLYADKLGVRLDGVVFAPGFKTTGGFAAAWAVCDQYAIGWNENYIEEAQAWDHIPALAAHETAHIYYKDNLPCNYPYDEDRAERCAQVLLAGGTRCEP